MNTFAILGESVVHNQGNISRRSNSAYCVATGHAKQDKGTKEHEICICPPEVGTARRLRVDNVSMPGSAGETRNAGTLIGWIRRSGECRILEARSCFRFIKQYKAATSPPSLQLPLPKCSPSRTSRSHTAAAIRTTYSVAEVAQDRSRGPPLLVRFPRNGERRVRCHQWLCTK